MNAYELADDVKNISNTIEALEWVQKATPLLRQQADHIAELEKYEPDVRCEDGVYRFDLPNGDEFVIVPPQIKELSDEEIKQIWYDLYPLSSSSYWDDKREGLAELKFARAILKKASEK